MTQNDFPPRLPATIKKLAIDLLSTGKWVLGLGHPLYTTALLANSATGESGMSHPFLTNNPMDLVKTALSVKADFVVTVGEMWSSPPEIRAERLESFLQRGPGIRFVKHNEFLNFSIFSEGQRWVSLTPLVADPDKPRLRSFGPIEFLETELDDAEYIPALRHAAKMAAL